MRCDQVSLKNVDKLTRCDKSVIYFDKTSESKFFSHFRIIQQNLTTVTVAQAPCMAEGQQGYEQLVQESTGIESLPLADEKSEEPPPPGKLRRCALTLFGWIPFCRRCLDPGYHEPDEESSDDEEKVWKREG